MATLSRSNILKFDIKSTNRRISTKFGTEVPDSVVLSCTNFHDDIPAGRIPADINSGRRVLEVDPRVSTDPVVTWWTPVRTSCRWETRRYGTSRRKKRERRRRFHRPIPESGSRWEWSNRILDASILLFQWEKRGQSPLRGKARRKWHFDVNGVEAPRRHGTSEPSAWPTFRLGTRLTHPTAAPASTWLYAHGSRLLLNTLKYIELFSECNCLF